MEKMKSIHFLEKMESKEKMYKKAIQDLTEQLYTAYKKIKDLTDSLKGIKVQESNKEKEKHYE